MKRLAVYPGSFDPPTLGHVDLIERASALFDELVVAVGINRAKEGFLSLDQRLEALHCCSAHLPNVRVDHFEGLLIDYVKATDCRVIVRGLRAVSDFDYEFRIAMANRKMAPDVETFFLMTREEHSFLASSVVREVATLGGDYHTFVPEKVAQIIEKHLRQS